MLCENCDTYDDGEGIVQFCPLHESAEILLEAVQEAWRALMFPHESKIPIGRVRNNLLAAMKKAKGEPDGKAKV